MLDRVLVLSASAGAGHVRAAQAIERALAAAGAAREVRHVDALDHTTKLFRRLHQQAYLDLWIVRLDADGRCRHFEEWPFWPTKGRVSSS